MRFRVHITETTEQTVDIDWNTFRAEWAEEWAEWLEPDDDPMDEMLIYDFIREQIYNNGYEIDGTEPPQTSPYQDGWNVDRIETVER